MWEGQLLGGERVVNSGGTSPIHPTVLSPMGEMFCFCRLYSAAKAVLRGAYFTRPLRCCWFFDKLLTPTTFQAKEEKEAESGCFSACSACSACLAW